MRIAVFSTKQFDRQSLDKANEDTEHELVYLEPRLNAQTVSLAEGFPAVSAFTNDTLDRDVLEKLKEGGSDLIALRCAGFNNVDLDAAEELDITVLRVPAYSPYAVAEHAVGLILALNRKLIRAASRVREQNFGLDGLMGFDLHGRTAGVVGTGKIGSIVAGILKGFGCRIIAFDVQKNADCIEMGVEYRSLSELAAESEIITLHCPLTPDTHHTINDSLIKQMRDGVMLINTSRGALIDTRAVINGLKRGKIAYLGIDVYEEESDLFFQDLSDKVIQDDVFARLLTFPNVLITAHQGFFTREAVEAIAETTIANISGFEKGDWDKSNQVRASHKR